MCKFAYPCCSRRFRGAAVASTTLSDAANGGAIVVNGGSIVAKTPPKLSERSPIVVVGLEDAAKPHRNAAKPRPSSEKLPRTAAKPPQTPVKPPRNVVKVRCIAAEIVLRDFLALLRPAFKFLRGPNGVLRPCT